MSEHSPTPWRVCDGAFWRIYDAAEGEVVNAEGVVSEELSDRIVRAVNLHGEMVEALRALIEALPAELGQDQLRTLIEAEKLLARAEGRSALVKATSTER